MTTASTPAHVSSGKSRTWFITGASTGFGRLLAEDVLKNGGKVVATARKLDNVADLESKYPERAQALALDVTDAGQVDSAVTQAFAKFGHVDVLVNNAGYGVAGAIEEVSEAEFMPMFETNVFGLLRVTRAFLPYLRKQRGGRILNLSSIGGLIASPRCRVRVGCRALIGEEGPAQGQLFGAVAVGHEAEVADAVEAVG